MPSAVIHQIPVGEMMNFSYLLADEEMKLCAAIDPGWEAEKIAAAAESLGWKIDKILLTHTHFDHINSLADLDRIAGGVPVYVHALESHALPPGLTVKTTDEGSLIEVGGLEIQCLHTPGHTPGGQCFLVEESIITGDSLFVDACGRVDLPGSDPALMIRSLARLASLSPTPPTHPLYPGHDYGPTPKATIGEQLKSNPYLRATAESMLL